jgi:uncharacterized membrane protein YfcA
MIEPHGDNLCIPLEKKAWEQAASDPQGEGLCSLLIFISAMLAAAAGTGGGGVFVPVFVMLSNVRAWSAVPLSQIIVMCGSIVNVVVFVQQRHPDFPKRPKIDYNCVVLFEPLLCLGVTFGVLVHQIMPKWFLLVLLCLTLGLALWRTGAKGIKQYNQESANPNRMDVKEDERALRESFAPWSVQEFEGHYLQVAGIISIWVIMLVASFHGLSACTWRFGAFLATLTLLLMAATVVIERYVVTQSSEKGDASEGEEGPSPKTPRWKMPEDASLWKRVQLPAIAFAAGFLGGMLGLGGGIIVGPVLLEVGMHSEAVQATTAMFVFLSSSLATVQFALLGRHIWHYALWYSGVVVVATIIGQRLCEIVIRVYRRYSAITLSMAGILLASLIALSIVGFGQVSEDIRLGRQLWFSTAGLCSGGVGIVTADVSPAHDWPQDLPAVPGFFLQVAVERFSPCR